MLSETKLLAVEYKGISVLPKTSIAVSTLFLQSFEPVSLIIDLFIVVIDISVVSPYIVVVTFDITIVVVNIVLKTVNLVIEIDKRFSDCFKGDHHLSLSSDSLFILILIPDFIPFVEIGNLMPEVTLWDRTVVLVSVWVIHWVGITFIVCLNAAMDWLMVV